MKTIYIDGFAGAGHHKSKGSGRLIEGSPLRALNVQPPFDRLHFVGINKARVEELLRVSHGRPNVKVHRGDCNRALLKEVFPTISYEKVASQRRMTRFWGDESWREAAYEPVPGLFGEMQEKASIDRVVTAFQDRLKKHAGFKFVPTPIPMRNSKTAIVYFLFFAAQKAVAEDIVKDIFNKYRDYGARADG